MIIVQIKGGLGNQLFSYASAYGIAKENNTELIIDRYIYDTSYFLRRYMLNDFPVIVEKNLVGYVPSQHMVTQLLYKINRKLRLDYQYKAKVITEIEEFQYQKIVTEGHNLYLNGYWQNYLYFDKYRKDITDRFTPKLTLNEESNSLLKEIIESNSVAIHIRRGDYVKFKGGKCLDISYYFRAIEKIREANPNNKHKFYIFTDDIGYCREIFNEKIEVNFIGDIANFSDLEEFYLMTKCKNFIIGNSSFSWWAAYLASYEEKVVIAPVVDMWKNDFYLPEWIKIKTNLQ